MKALQANSVLGVTKVCGAYSLDKHDPVAYSPHCGTLWAYGCELAGG